MKNFKKLMMLAILTITAQKAIIADDDMMYEDDMDVQDAQPRHQGFGRIFTAAENTLTLHPGNAVNSLATGNQADTSFGYERNDEGQVKARKANTSRNKQQRAKDEAKRKKEAAKKKKAAKNKSTKKKDETKNSSWFFGKKSKNNSEQSMTKKQPKKVVVAQDSFEDNSAE